MRPQDPARPPRRWIQLYGGVDAELSSSIILLLLAVFFRLLLRKPEGTVVLRTTASSQRGLTRCSPRHAAPKLLYTSAVGVRVTISGSIDSESELTSVLLLHAVSQFCGL